MFSIIVPVHNVEAYVDYCIKSIISQSFSEFELILVVNASGDGSYKKCKNWEEKDSRIHVIYTEVPGVSHWLVYIVVYMSHKKMLKKLHIHQFQQQL